MKQPAPAARGRTSLDRYHAKRDFTQTREPKGRKSPAAAPRLRFVVQRHDARRLHYDFRLEWDGVLKSWAVPKGPSLDPREKRLAVHTEDHPLEYAEFEGTIPPKQYGAGEVEIWDRGTWAPEGDVARDYRRGTLKFSLHGKKLRGRWALVRMRNRSDADAGKENWLLLKERDDEAREGAAAEVTQRAPGSARRPSRKARVEPVPDWIGPQLATLTSALPGEGKWTFEVKYDGYRLGARIDDGRARLLTRNRHDWTARFREVATALSGLDVSNAWIDGEAVVFQPDGRTSFGALQRALDRTASGDITFVAFDLPFLNGEDLRARPLGERKALLREILVKAGHPRLRFSESIEAPPEQVMRQACEWGLEGLIAKRADAPYESRRSRAWLKLKCRPRDEFVIGGYTEPQGSRVGIGALLLGTFEDGRLVYRGRVGTGLDDRELAGILERLRPLEQRTHPFAEIPAYHPKKAAIRWVKPALVAEIEYAEITDQGAVRQGSFVGLREDKPAREVARPDRRSPPPAAELAEVEGVRITHPDRVYSDTEGVTKLELARYYAWLGERILREVKCRPLSLVRCPNGNLQECFFQRHPPEGSGFESTRSRSRRTGADKDYVLASSLKGIIAMVQWGVIEFHTWGVTAPRLDRPDRIILDLDPDPKLPWDTFREACALVRELLDHLELRWFLKTTGGKGIHFVMPLERRHDWDTVKGFSRGIAERLAGALPSLFTSRMTKARRPGKVFIDYLRNADRATAVAAYAARARAGLPVSMPIEWADLDHDLRGAHFDVRNARRHIESRGNDPWADYDASRQRISAGMQRALGQA